MCYHCVDDPGDYRSIGGYDAVPNLDIEIVSFCGNWEIVEVKLKGHCQHVCLLGRCWEG